MSKNEIFLGEKFKTGGNIAEATLTSVEGFAAKNSHLVAENFILGWSLNKVQ